MLKLLIKKNKFCNIKINYLYIIKRYSSSYIENQNGIFSNNQKNGPKIVIEQGNLERLKCDHCHFYGYINRTYKIR